MPSGVAHPAAVQALRAPVGGNCSPLMAPFIPLPIPPTPLSHSCSPCLSQPVPSYRHHPHQPLLAHLLVDRHTCFHLQLLPVLMGWDAFIGAAPPPVALYPVCPHFFRTRYHRPCLALLLLHSSSAWPAVGCGVGLVVLGVSKVGLRCLPGSRPLAGGSTPGQ